jgi:REP element-mobilizing transposase RayT
MIIFNHVTVSPSSDRSGWFFFTVTLADRSGDLLVRHVERLRSVYAAARKRDPFETIAICVLPDHMHVIWALPPNDADFSRRWSLIKHGFSCGLAENAQRSRSKSPGAKREFGNAAIGSTPSATMPTSRATSITSISIR